MEVYVINLKRNEDRKAFMQKQLNELGISHQIIEATDGRALTELEKAQIYDAEKAKKFSSTPLRTGEIGCADSHRRIYQKIIAEKIPYTLILEDDVILDSKILEVLQADFLQTQKFDWLQIDYNEVGWIFLRRWFRSVKIYASQSPAFLLQATLKFPYITTLCIFEAWRERWHAKKPAIVKFYRPLYLTGAYIITYEGALKLAPLTEKVVLAADMLPNKARRLYGLKMLAVSPLIAHQYREQFVSDIAGD